MFDCHVPLCNNLTPSGVTLVQKAEKLEFGIYNIPSLISKEHVHRHFGDSLISLHETEHGIFIKFNADSGKILLFFSYLFIFFLPKIGST